MPLVLCYHAISSAWPHALAVRPDALMRQVTAALRWGWRPAAAGDVVAGRSRALHVTFDDAYRSVLLALPLLDRLRVPATVFVCTEYARKGRPLELPPLHRLPDRYRHELETLAWDDLRDLAERGIEVGSHTRTHSDLRSVPERELEHEVAESRAEIEAELGRPCRFFAYPYGQHDRRVRKAVQRAGYEAAFGLIGLGGRDGPFAIGRVEPGRDDGPSAMLLKGSPVWPLVSPSLRKVRSAMARLG